MVFLRILIIGFTVITITTCNNVYANTKIIVNKGSFSTVQDAAIGEDSVDWLDNDNTDDTACTECFAATELAKFLPKCIDIGVRDITFGDITEMPSEDDVFLIGSTESKPLIATLVSESPDLKTEQSFYIKSFKDNNRTITIIQGKTRVGTLYGVYEYLHLNGMRFYGLGEKGTISPNAKATSLPTDINHIGNPDFLTRGFWLEEGRFADKDFYYWMARNKLNFWPGSDPAVRTLKKLGVKFTDGGHEVMCYCLNPTSQYPYNHPDFNGDDNLLEDVYPVSGSYLGDENSDGQLSYYEAHPEWFGLVNGTRSKELRSLTTGDNYCTTNEDATKELTKNIILSLKDGEYKYTDILNVWLLDNGRWCECGNCIKLKSQTDKLFNVVYVILKELKKARQSGFLDRDVTISMCSYHETLPTPTVPLPDDFDYDNFMLTFFPIERCYVHSLADPACTEINKFMNDFYLGWFRGSKRPYKGQVCIGEYYNVSSIMSLPVVFPTIMAVDIPWYYKTGSRHFCYMHSPFKKWGTWTLNQSLMAALIWDTSLDADGFLDEYFSLYYPTTSEYAKKYYGHLEKASANIKAFKHYVGTEYGEHRAFYKIRGRLTDFSKELFPLDHLQYDAFESTLNDGPDITEMMDAMTRACFEIEAALLHCENKTEQTRLTEDYNRYEYGMAMYQFYYHIIRTSMFHRKDNAALAKMEFSKVIKYKEILEKIDDLPWPKEHGTSRNGYEATQCQKDFEYFNKLYGND